MKLLRKILSVVILILFVISECFAAVVSGNDGSAFITKSEFDSLKNDFQAQIDQYNSSIDNKIDQAIASYLAGVKVSKTQTIKTGFVLEGNSSGGIIFAGKKYNWLNQTNELYTSDRIFNIFLGTYGTNSYFIQDCYDTFAFQGSYSKGNSSNFLFVLDSDNHALTSKSNVQMNASRIYIVYSTTNATNGMFWKSISQQLNNPTTLSSSTSAGVSSTTAQGIGMQRINSSSVFTTLMNHRIYADNNNPNGGINQPLYKTAQENKTLTATTQCYDVSITGTTYLVNAQWPNGCQNKFHTINEEWGSEALITTYNTNRVNYTYTYKLRNCGGVGANEIPSNFNPTVQGYGLKWKFTDRSIGDIKYNKIKADWGEDYSYSGGLPVCPYVKDGVFEISFTPASNVRIAFTNAQNETFPTTSNARLKRFSYRVSGSGSNFTENQAYLDLTAGTTYDFKVNMSNEKLFLTADMAEQTIAIRITQVGDAKFTENT